MKPKHFTVELLARHIYRAEFEGSDRLFNACWRQYLAYLDGGIDSPTCDADVTSWLEQIAADKVNNCRSAFYIHG